MADPADLQATLKALSDAYAAQLPEKLKQIMQAKAAPGEEQRKRIQVLLSELHQTAIRRDASAGDQSGLIAIARPDQIPAGCHRIFCSGR
jgi:hypothetical protein